MTTPRKILATSALPYANGSIHLGHMVEHIQTDIWVRFQKMRGHECYYVCADDTHGTPVMLAAQKAGRTPEAMIDAVRAEHLADFSGFHIGYDNYYTTHSDENREFATLIYQRLKADGKIESRSIEQLYDPEKEMFLPDRFVKGECPKCHSKDQYGDNCEVCGATYAPTELIRPYSAISGAAPVLKSSEHFFFKLGQCEAFLREWTEGATLLNDGRTQTHLQPEALNKMKEWLDGGLQDWDISRDAPYFGFEIPDAPGKYFYVWLDAPIGYMASFKNLCARLNLDFDAWFGPNSDAELVHFIGKDILYFHALFWPATLKFAGFRAPTAVFAHGFLTVDGQKMSKSRGTFITARSYLEAGLNPEWMRYYIGAKLNGRIEDIDLNLQDFVARVNSDLVGKYVNIAARAAGFIQKRFSGSLKDVAQSALVQRLQAASDDIAADYEAREYARALRHIMALADEVNAYVDANKPWEMAKNPEKTERLHEVCSELINAFAVLSVYLTPVLPQVAQEVAAFLNLPPLHWAQSRMTLGEHTIGPYTHLMQRIDAAQVDALLAHNRQSMAAESAAPSEPPAQTTEPIALVCAFEDFQKIDLRVGEVIACEAVQGSSKLLKFAVNLGSETRTIFSGIAASYPEPAKLVGRKVVVVANFAPRKMAKFGMSEGMILSAPDSQGCLKVIEAGESVPGARVG